ncbi:putative reverse transcriptase domain-containing protein [Tanacetum coccineum]
MAVPQPETHGHSFKGIILGYIGLGTLVRSCACRNIGSTLKPHPEIGRCLMALSGPGINSGDESSVGLQSRACRRKLYGNIQMSAEDMVSAKSHTCGSNQDRIYQKIGHLKDTNDEIRQFLGLAGYYRSAPILALPEGSEDFVVYYDARSHKGLGAVLMQREKVIAYASRQQKGSREELHHS